MNEEKRLPSLPGLSPSSTGRAVGRTVALVCALHVILGLGPAQLFAQSAPCPSVVDIERELVASINAIRTQPRLCGDQAFAAAEPVAWNALLSVAARLHAAEMSRLNYFSHRSPEGLSPGDRIERVGYLWKTYGENIGKGQTSVAGALADWLDSPQHCAAIMQKGFRHVGLACADGGDENYWVLELGLPR